MGYYNTTSSSFADTYVQGTQNSAYPDFSGTCSGYRHYSANLSRWLNRDPIGEKGGANQYLFIRNSAINKVDSHGLVDYRVTDGSGDSAHLGISVTGESLCDCQSAGKVILTIFTTTDMTADSIKGNGVIIDGKPANPIKHTGELEDPKNPGTVVIAKSVTEIPTGVCPTGGSKGSKKVEVKFGDKYVQLVRPGGSLDSLGSFVVTVTWKFECTREDDKECKCKSGFKCNTKEGLTSDFDPLPPAEK